MLEKNDMLDLNLLISQPGVDGFKILPQGKSGSHRKGVCLLSGEKTWQFVSVEPILVKPGNDR